MKWFPFGRPPADAAGPRPIDSVACQLLALDAPLIAVQEVVLAEGGRRAVNALLQSLNERSGGDWRSRFDDCPLDGRQHLGFLWNAREVDVERDEMLTEANPPNGCGHHLRPAFAVLAHRQQSSVYAMTVHLDSGGSDRDHSNRRRALSGLSDRIEESIRAGRRVVFLGDFNTMGCERCRPRIDAASERDALHAFAQGHGLRPLALPASVRGTERTRRHGWAELDFAFDSEAPAGATLETFGLCAPAAQQCGRPTSDHCPIVLTL